MVLSAAEKEVKWAPKRTFKGHKADCTLKCKDVTGPAGSRPSWTSFSPQGYYTLAAEWALLKHCRDLDSFGLGKHCWLSALVRPGYLFRTDPGGDWHFSLGHVGFSAVL